MGGRAMTFLHPWVLGLGAAAALLIILGRLSHARRLRRLGDYLGGPRGAERLSASNLYRRRTERVALFVAAAIVLSVSAAEPRGAVSVAESTEAPEASQTAVLAIDISASMQATDVSPTRLARAVEVARGIVDAADGTRVGLMLFAGNSYVLAPPTHDLRALAFLLDGVGPTLLSPQDPGSLVSVAIREASGLLGAESPMEERTVVLISDGEAGEPDGSVAQAVREASSGGVSVHTVGVGTLRGAPIALPGGTGSGRERSDALPPTVSRLQEPLLRRIARDGGGDYVRFDDDGGIRRLASSLEGRPFSGSPEPTVAGIDSTLFFGTAGLLLLLLDGVLEVGSARLRARSRRLEG